MRLADDKIAALKTATHALITEVGGLEAAASVCRVGVSVLSEYQSRRHVDRVMPLDVAMQLEEVAGAPIVTGALARMQGYTLSRPDADVVPSVGLAVAQAARNTGAAAAAFLEASADGHIDATEASEMRRLLEAVRDNADAALAGLAVPALRVVSA